MESIDAYRGVLPTISSSASEILEYKASESSIIYPVMLGALEDSASSSLILEYRASDSSALSSLIVEYRASDSSTS